MKCLNCGEDSNQLLCTECISDSALDKIFNQISSYNADTCDNEYVREYVGSFENSYEARNGITDILSLFDFSVTEYYWCKYYKMSRDERFEEAAIKYLSKYEEDDVRKQIVLNDLLGTYLRNDFIKPRKWCEHIRVTKNLYCELYYAAAQYYAMVGDYDYADEIIKLALSYCANESYHNFLYYSRESEVESLTKLSDTVNNYRTKKPYWPTTEERRRAVAKFYDEKGIAHPRIELKVKKVAECDFKPIEETFETVHMNYCAFWCSETFSIVAAKGIYQIAAVKVRNGKMVDEFQSFIRPWDGAKGKIAAVKEAGIDIDILERAEDVDQVMIKFFAFVEDDVLISTSALGNQAKLISRAARYSGMKEIKNFFMDLLDYAADIYKEFDNENNTREYLLKYFNIPEGKDSLEKAKRNMEIYNKLMDLDN